MSGVPLKKAIASGEWYECTGSVFSDEIRLKVRVLGFDKTTARDVNPDLEVDIEGVLWLMSLEVVNLCKQPIEAYYVRDLLTLVDQDGYEFERLSSDLDRDKPSRIHRFSGWSDAAKLVPKVKVQGTIAYALPDEDSEYRLQVKDGEIRPA